MDTSPEARRRRAEQRREHMTIGRRDGDVPLPDTGLGRIELAFRLTQAAWAMSGKPWPNLARAELPVRRIPGRKHG